MPTGEPTVLLVTGRSEDDPATAPLESALRARGYACDVVAGRHAALDRFVQCGADVVASHGTDAARDVELVRQLRAISVVPILLLSEPPPAPAAPLAPAASATTSAPTTDALVDLIEWSLVRTERAAP